MKKLAIFSIGIYLITVFILSKNKNMPDKNLKEDIITKIAPNAPDIKKLKTPIVKKKKAILKIEDKLVKKILNHFPKTLKTTIIPIEEIELYKRGHKISALKVLVSLKNRAGDKSSYNALINKNTGQILQTFNRPHFEFHNNKGLRYKGKI